MRPELDQAAWLEAADAVTDEILSRADVAYPPVDLFAVAGSLGISIVWDASQPVRARHKRLRTGAAIILAPDDRPERLQWAAAHELGEVFAHRVLEHIDDPHQSPDLLRENTANLLASRLLLPTHCFHNDVEQTDGDLLALKHIYSTASHELIAWRLLDVFSPAIVSIFDQGRLSRRRGNGGRHPARLHPLERRCWQQVHQSGSPCELEEGELRVRGWPVHEIGWRREILLATTCCDEYAC